MDVPLITETKESWDLQWLGYFEDLYKHRGAIHWQIHADTGSNDYSTLQIVAGRRITSFWVSAYFQVQTVSCCV